MSGSALDASPGLQAPGPPAPGLQAAGLQAPGPQAAGLRARGSLSRGLRRWRLALSLIAFVGLGVVMIALLTSSPQTNSYLDPASPAGDGAHALTDLLGERGFLVVRAYSPGQALAAVRSPGPRSAPATLVITSPELLSRKQRRLLATASADLVLVAPGRASLAALAPAIAVEAYPGPASGRLVRPGCELTAARLAGSANISGYTYDAPANATACYLVGDYPSLVQIQSAGRTITVIGSGTPLSNAYLDANGNAALALNLLASHHHIVWLTPEPATVPTIIGQPSGSQRSVPSLLPTAVQLLILQLLVVVVIAALWRARRFGPLITENLPVIVRASETVEGHARLYQSRRARGRAAAALRSAMLARVLPALGLTRTSAADAVTDALASRSRLGQAEIAGIVYGQPPATDAELVDLARNLDALEREVRSQ